MIRCLARRVFGLLLLTLCLPSIAEKAHNWEKAKVISQSLGSSPAGLYTAPVGTATVTTPINLRSNVVVVETGEYRYTWQEFTRSPNWHRFAVLIVNDDVRFYRDGQWFVVMDNEGKKHKFSLIGAAKK